MNISTSAVFCRRNVLATLAVALVLLAFARAQPAEVRMLQKKFRGIGGAAMVIDSMGNHQYFTITSDTGRPIPVPARLTPKAKSYLDYSDDTLPVPRFMHFVWREGNVRHDSYVDEQGEYHPMQWIGGTIVGDYTIPVAERIPDEVLDEIRANGGGLRLKFRVHDKGVYLGWDIERRPGYKPGALRDPKRPGVLYHFPAEHHLAGGDFREARIFDGKPVRKGWYIDADGQRVEIDF